MRVQICYMDGNGEPTKLIREIQGCKHDCIKRFRNNSGEPFLGIGNSSMCEIEDLDHIWKYVKEISYYTPFPDKPNEDELIIKYVVEDLDSDWNTPSSSMDMGSEFSEGDDTTRRKK